MEDSEKTREQLIEELALLRNSLVQMQDLANQQRSQNSPEIQTQKYKALFENFLDGILLTARDDRILDANEGACRILGRTREELCRVGREEVEDITDRKRVEEALRESEIRYRTLFENMSNAVVIYKPDREGQDFVITDFNEAAAQIEQIRKSEVIGRRLLDVFPGVREFGLFSVFQRV